MSFSAGDRVLIARCEDDSRAVGKTGEIVDEVLPGPLTQGRWTVKVNFWIGTVLCHSHELSKGD
ncbi:hypothetical protein ACH47Z_18265 [Streptomyces sp. NPDC020192]|uniref:hypothetical protein n=1 Tax=Streptomyces sp. NPDC020192 TaxID=3365066 RepID=UPI0037A8CB84